MSMNYVGSISIIDRGDAPAKAVIDKNTRSLAQRVADETKDELNKVMDRVDNIYVSYEMSTQTMFENPRGSSPSVEYVEDIKELEEIIKDTVKKKKYQQQVTIFIVGFQDVCSQKMQLLQQVNQFFLENARPEQEDEVEEKMEIDLEEASNKVNESLNTAEELTKKLSNLNQDIIEWLVNYANTKASNKGKKRLEKNLESAKNDMNSLSEKLLNLQTELEEKDEKVQQLSKQLEAKTQEAIRYKTAAEVAKKSAQDNESHTSTLQDEIARRDEKIQELRTKLSRLEIAVSESHFEKEMSLRKLDNTNTKTKLFEILPETNEDMNAIDDVETLVEIERLAKLQEEVDHKKVAITEAEREMDKLHKEQMHELKKIHFEEVEELKRDHREEVAQLTDELNTVQRRLIESERNAQEVFEESDGIRAKLIELQLQDKPDPRKKPPIQKPKQDQENLAPRPESFYLILSSDISLETSFQDVSNDMLHDRIGQERNEIFQTVETSTVEANGRRNLQQGTGLSNILANIGKSIAELSTGDDDQTRPESRPSTKDTKSSKKSDSKPVKPPAKSPSRALPTKPLGRSSKDLADASVQDDGGDASKASVEKSNETNRQNARQSKNLEPLVESGDKQEFSNAYELDDDESWGAVPPNQVIGRFSQYRQLSLLKIKELEEQLNITLTKTHRKVNSLKSQFNEHKAKWEAERKILIEQVEQAQKLQTDAEKEADAAMTQLEEFINEQEKLEDEEEMKRQEVLKTMSRPGTTAKIPAVPATVEQKPTDAAPEAEKPKAEEAEGERIPSDTSEHELKKLMQQTDDAKSRPGSTASPEDEGGLAPWLTPDYIQGKSKPKPRVPSESRTASQTEILASRLTSAADAELQNLMPSEDRTDTQHSTTKSEIPEPKSELKLPPIDLIKGDKEKLRSRASSKASRPPRIYGSHLDEKDEETFFDKISKSSHDGARDDESESETESEEDDDIELAPWLLPAPKKKVEKVPPSRQGSVRRSVTSIRDGSVESPALMPEASQSDKRESSAKRSRQSSKKITPEDRNVVAERELDETEDSRKPTKHEENVVSRSTLDTRSQQRSRISTHLNQESGQSTLKEDDGEVDEPEPRRKVKRKHRKVKETGESTKDKDNKDIDRNIETKDIDKEAAETDNKDKIKAESKKRKVKRDKEIKNNKHKEDHEDLDSRADASRQSITRHGQRYKKNKQATDLEDVEGEDSGSSFESEGDLDSDVEELHKKGKITKMSRVSHALESDNETDSDLDEDEELPIKVKEVAADKGKNIQGDDLTLATDEEKIIVMEERARSRSVRSTKQGGEKAERGSKPSSARQKPGTPEQFHDTKENKEVIVSQNEDYPNQLTENESNKLDNKVNIADSEKIHDPEIDQHEQESIIADSVATPYTRQMSNRPAGHLETESVREGRESVRTPFSQLTSNQATGRRESDDHRSDPDSFRPEPDSARTPYTRQMSNRPAGHIESESVKGDLDSFRPEPDSARTPYTRQMSNRPGGRVEADSKLTGRDSLKTPYTRQMIHQPNGRVGTESMADLITPQTQPPDTGRQETNRSSDKQQKEQLTEIPSQRNELLDESQKLPTASEEALEKSSRQSGAISAPPAVEPGEDHTKNIDGKTPREDYESKPVTPRVKSASQSVKHLVQQKPDTPKQAFRTPRSSRSSSMTSFMSDESILIDQQLEPETDEGVAMEVSKVQSEALNNLKEMMVEDNLNLTQQKTLDSLRSALKSIASSDQKLNDKQLERTVTILSLASQLAHESAELGVMPDSVFNSFASMGSRSVSSLSDNVSSFHGSAKKERKLVSKQSLRQLTRERQRTPLEEEPAEDAVFKLVPEKSGKRHKSPTKEAKPSPVKQHQDTKHLKDTDQHKGREVKQVQQGRASTSNKTVSGSMNLEYGSSRADSFSASLPRTMTSSEWRNMDLHDPFSPEPVQKTKEKQKARIEKEAANENAAFEGIGNGIREGNQSHEITVVISPRKKSRAAISRDEMLYGDSKEEENVENLENEKAEEVYTARTKNETSKISYITPRSKILYEGRLHEYFGVHGIGIPKLICRAPKTLRELDHPAINQSKSSKINQPYKTVTFAFPDLKPKQRESTGKPIKTIVKIETDDPIQSSQNSALIGGFAIEGIKLIKDKEFNTQADRNTRPYPENGLGRPINIGTKAQKSDCFTSAKRSRSEQRPSFTKKQSVISNATTKLFVGNRNHYDITSTVFNLKDTLKGELTMGNESEVFPRSRSLVESLSSFSCQAETPVPVMVSVGTQCEEHLPHIELEQKVLIKPAIEDLEIQHDASPKPQTPKTAPSSVPKSPKSSTPVPKSPKSVSSSAPKSPKSAPSKKSASSNHRSEPLVPPSQTTRLKSQSTESVDTNQLRPVSRGHSPLTAPTPGTSVSDVLRAPSFVSEDQRAPSPKSAISEIQFSPRTAPTPGTSVTDVPRQMTRSTFDQKVFVPSSAAVSELHRQMTHSSGEYRVPAPTPLTPVSELTRQMTQSSLDLKDHSPRTAVYELQRQMSETSGHRQIAPYFSTAHKETQTEFVMPAIETEPIQGSTEEEIRESSAKSRASLRSQFKNRLDETRQAVEERRTKSPVISVPSQKSIDDELIIEDEDDDLPIPDDQKAGELQKEDTFEAGTSPPPNPKMEKQISVSSRHSINLSEHPVVKEYLRAYSGIHNFKEAISRILEDKDQMSASQILVELDNIPFNKDTKVVPQIETMTENIYYVLNEVSQVVNSVLQNDRGPVVSSLMMGMSRDPTQRTIIRERSGATADNQPTTRASQRSMASKLDSASTERQQYKDLQEQYEKLQNMMSEDAKKFEEQQKHNVVVMMEMQDTINQLQRELSSLGKQPRRPASEHMSTPGASQPTESAVMFTRLDSERNAKIMKKAVNEEKLDANRYKEAVVQMDEYVNLPAQRLAHLVRKYVHHCRMKEIEQNVQGSNSLNENVFEILDKMEALQNQRAKRWADKMDEMGSQRMQLANILMETFDDIERESGIFLIKPMYSYRGREPKDRYSGKISRPFRPQRTLSPMRDPTSAYAPAPTPASNMRPVRLHQAKEAAAAAAAAAQLSQAQAQQEQAHQNGYDTNRALDGDNVGLTGSSVRYVGSQPRATWNMADSQPRLEASHSNNSIQGNTPRILELDINRMMIGQNTISASIPGLSNDRLVNASNSNLRSYMTVNRPTGPNSAGKSERPLSGSRQRDSPVPPPSPTNRSGSTSKRVRMSDIEVPTVMSTPQPLPPIGSSPTLRRNSGGSGSKGRQSPTRIPIGEVSPSPPGSRGSARQSPDIENR